MSLEICKNCERTIGNFEQAYIYNNKIVCEKCNSMLVDTPEPVYIPEPVEQPAKKDLKELFFGKLYKIKHLI